MPPLPAHCPKCGAIFPSNVISIDNSDDITIGNIQERCPIQGCGGTARVIEGNFDFVGHAVRVRRAPPRTLAILTVLQEALQDVERGKPTDEAISKIERASPELASAIRKTIGSAGKPLLGTLLFALLASCSMSTRLDWNQLVDQVHVYRTGAAPYPGLGQSGSSASETESKAEPSRQQRRYKERQTKKRQRQIERQRPKKP
ncbi:hypothetical protein ACFQX9_23450 [Bradyrhizobium sp. GCM10028915]|uniref:hypothetical protein n=1 Tax=Bradyrhizobium sp. GCM10028915 TaxID=3273385 RepID=UPI0036118D2D